MSGTLEQDEFDARLARGAAALGFQARMLRASKRRLDDLALPAIVHVYGNHWVVLYEVDADAVSVSDPRRGLQRLRRTGFEAAWSGWVVLLEPTSSSRASRR